MKIELDYDNKTITIKDSVNADELINKLNELKIDLKEWTLNQDVVLVESPNIYPSPNQPYPAFPWGAPNIYTYPISIVETFINTASTEGLWGEK